MTFRVGQKVICVDASPSCFGFDLGLSKNQIYTVAVVADYWDGTGLDLVENPAPGKEGHHRAYAARRFRPIVDRKTDISIFTQMLNPSNQGVDA